MTSTSNLLDRDRHPRTTPQRLFVEWQQLCRQPRHLRRAAAWELPGPPPRHLDEVLERCGYQGDRYNVEADQVLHRVVEVAAGDDLAARVVLQRILPGLLSQARRRGRIEAGGHATAFDELVAAAWLVIRTYPTERRPARVAANLLRDAEYQAFVRTKRLRWSIAEFCSEDVLRIQVDAADPASIVVDDPKRRLDELLDRARQSGMAPADLELVQALGRGESPLDLADQLGITDRSVRTRRRKALERLRRLDAA